MTIKRLIKRGLILVLIGLILWLFIAYWISTNDCNRNAVTPSNPMKAIVNCEYGIENLQLRELEKPSPNDNEVLVRVRAASVNPVDGHLIRGAWPMRPMSGLRKPKNIRFGTDFSGVVEAVGKNVTNFKPGDEVFGAKNGAVADYICVNADRAIVMKPANITFEQAGSVGIAGVTALQGLRDKGHIQAGQKVLINGASGGVGTFAVQLAKSFGADVTAVCSTGNVEQARSLGADRVVDYTRQDFTELGLRHDVMLDIAGNRSFLDFRKALTDEATVVVVGGHMTYRGLGPLPHIAGTILKSRFRSQTVTFFVAKVTTEDLTFLAELLEAGTLRSVIDRQYDLDEAPDALSYLGEGHAKGKVVISV
jgi:NADPH:quinone reductase-like Zn-dependent oxidoreductase